MCIIFDTANVLLGVYYKGIFAYVHKGIGIVTLSTKGTLIIIETLYILNMKESDI